MAGVIKIINGDKHMDTKNNQKNTPDNDKDLDFLKIQYQVLANRELSHDNMIWNVPSLLFVAQSLLWTIALSPEIYILMRCLISVISTVMGFISLQLFQRNRLMEIADSEQLYSIEQFFAQLKNGKSNSSIIIHHQIKKRTVLTKKTSKSLMTILENNAFFRNGILVKMRSFSLWITAFWLIFVLSVIILLCNIFEAVKTYTILLS